MKSCTFVKGLSTFVFLVVSLSFYAPGTGQAQSTGYVPPPMFDTENNTAPAPAAPPVAAKPKLMQPIIDDKDKTAKSVVKKEAEKKTIPAKAPATPVPPKKPGDVAIKSPAQPQTAPIEPPVVQAPVVPAVKTPETPKTIPLKAKEDNSLIKGPKTMPALPAQEVQSEQIFQEKAAAPAANEPTMLERQQIKAKEQTKAMAPLPKQPGPDVAPVAFEPAATAPSNQRVLKKIIAFQAGQIALSKPDLEAIAAGVNEQMDQDESWKAEIRSYATPFGTGLSSDRRIALSRALSLRTSLIGYGVPASKINVLAEGLETQAAGKPGDRIDLYLYAPQK